MLSRFTKTLLGLLCFAATGMAESASPPNIVVIIGDDQHWQDYGFMGHPHIKTPHLDRLASQSLLFDRGYVPSSLCSPSLSTIVSGLFPHQHRITSNDPVGGNKTRKLTDPNFIAGRERYNQFMRDTPTLPRLLAEKQYLSFQTGKWWQGDFKTGGFTHGMTLGSRHGDQGLKIGREGNQPVTDFLDEAQAAQKPFFVWYAPFMPHTPHNPPQRLLDKYKDVAPNLETAKYWAMIEWYDEVCGDLLQTLEDRKLAANTLVILLCDNGFRPLGKQYAPKTKQSQFDGGLRTPLMIRWPGKVKPSKSEALVSSIDIAPTILKAVGLPKTKEMQGVDLLDAKAVSSRPAIFGEIFTHDSQDFENPAASLRWRWVIQGYDKLIIPAPQNEPTAAIELYDLKKDPEELENLATSQPEKIEKLKQVLETWWNP